MNSSNRALQELVAEGDTPGIQFVRVDPQGIRQQYCGGVTDVAAKTPVQDGSLFSTYSLTKTFTAAGVFRLIDQGKLSLDEPLSKSVPESPYGSEVRIRHLLAQTSGIPNPIPLRWVHLAKDHGRFDEDAALRHILGQHPDLSFRPGERYAYSNISYWLLGRVIERISGKGYVDFMASEIFQTLGAQAELRFAPAPDRPRVKGYIPRWSWTHLLKSFVSDPVYWGEHEDGWLHIHDHFLNGPAFGGLLASAVGIGRFLTDQLAGQSPLFSGPTRDLFMQRQSDPRGKTLPMSLGWHVAELDGETYLYKEGGGLGFHAEMRLYPVRQIGSVLLVNNGTFNTRKTLSRLDRR